MDSLKRVCAEWKTVTVIIIIMESLTARICMLSYYLNTCTFVQIVCTIYSFIRSFENLISYCRKHFSSCFFICIHSTYALQWLSALKRYTPFDAVTVDYCYNYIIFGITPFLTLMLCVEFISIISFKWYSLGVFLLLYTQSQLMHVSCWLSHQMIWGWKCRSNICVYNE